MSMFCFYLFLYFEKIMDNSPPFASMLVLDVVNIDVQWGGGKVRGKKSIKQDPTEKLSEIFFKL